MTIDQLQTKILNIQSEIYGGKLSDAKKVVWQWWLRFYQKRLNELENPPQIPLDTYVNGVGEPLPF